MDRAGEYVVNLHTNGLFFAERSMTCGEKTFKDAVAQWERNGFEVTVIRQPQKAHAK